MRIIDNRRLIRFPASERWNANPLEPSAFWGGNQAASMYLATNSILLPLKCFKINFWKKMKKKWNKMKKKIIKKKNFKKKK